MYQERKIRKGWNRKGERGKYIEQGAEKYFIFNSPRKVEITIYNTVQISPQIFLPVYSTTFILCEIFVLYMYWVVFCTYIPVRPVFRADMFGMWISPNNNDVDWFMLNCTKREYDVTALHWMKSGLVARNVSVCLSLYPTNAWIVTKRKKNLSRFLYYTKDH